MKDIFAAVKKWWVEIEASLSTAEAILAGVALGLVIGIALGVMAR